MSLSKNGVPITTLDKWEELAGPKSKVQWKDCRSAKELAKAWLKEEGKELPCAILTALNSHAEFGAASKLSGEPEAKLKFDAFRGETRNADLAVDIEDSHGPYLMAVEGKADETFGDTIKNTYAKAKSRLDANPKSKGVERIENLKKFLFGDKPAVENLDELRYQLLTACAGAICEAERKGYKRTLMLVHEFITDKTSDKKHEKNARDLNAFIGVLSQGKAIEMRSDHAQICGPINVPGKLSIDLYIGKVSSNLRK